MLERSKEWGKKTVKTIVGEETTKRGKGEGKWSIEIGGWEIYEGVGESRY